MAIAVTLVSLGMRANPAFAQEQNVVIQWNNAALQGVRDSKIGPPMVARALFIVQNCIYDAWAAYDPTAVGTIYGGSLRRPPEFPRARPGGSLRHPPEFPRATSGEPSLPA